MRREGHLSKEWVSKGLELVGLEQEHKCGVWWLGLMSSFYDITTLSLDVLFLFVCSWAYLSSFPTFFVSFLSPFVVEDDLELLFFLFCNSVISLGTEF